MEIIQPATEMSNMNENKKTKNANASRSRKFNLYRKLEIGTIIWTKIGKRPLWPSIVIDEQESKTHLKKDNGKLMVHIYYFFDSQRHNWVTIGGISEFSSREAIFTKFPKLKALISRRRQTCKWNKAVDEALSLALINKDQRVATYFGNNSGEISNVQLPSSSQIRPKDPKDESLHPTEDVTESTNIKKKKNMIFNQHLPDIRSPELPCTGNRNNIKNTLIFPSNVLKSQKDPNILLPELYKEFYSKGWLTGIGGAISIKNNNQIFIISSGLESVIHMETIEQNDLYGQNINGIDIPTKENVLFKRLTTILKNIYNECNAGAIIYMNSLEVLKTCIMYPEYALQISGFEMIQGIYNKQEKRLYNIDEKILVPIIENSKCDEELGQSIKIALFQYPSASAILIRDHGMYVWGKDWMSAKTQCECYDYMIKIMLFKKVHT